MVELLLKKFLLIPNAYLHKYTLLCVLSGKELVSFRLKGEIWPELPHIRSE